MSYFSEIPKLIADMFKLFHDGDRYHIEISPLICGVN